MGKINWKILNFAFWLEIVLSYLLPYKVVDSFRYEAGFPISFITVYDTKIGINPLMSMSLNPIALLLNGIIIYLVISSCVKAYNKLKPNHEK